MRHWLFTLQRAHDAGYQHGQGDDFHSPVVLALFERHAERVDYVLQVEEEPDAGAPRPCVLLVRHRLDLSGVAHAQVGHPNADRAQYQCYGVHAGEPELTVQYAGQSGAYGQTQCHRRVHDAHSQRFRLLLYKRRQNERNNHVNVRVSTIRRQLCVQK